MDVFSAADPDSQRPQVHSSWLYLSQDLAYAGYTESKALRNKMAAS